MGGRIDDAFERSGCVVVVSATAERLVDGIRIEEAP
ncbi:hypothetical protein ABIC29_002338 [Agromyces sp. PvR057]